MGLVNREIDPPLVPLVDVHQHQLSLHIHTVIAVRRALAQIYDLKLPGSLRVEIGLIGPQLKAVPYPLRIRKTHLGLLKLPGVHRHLVLVYVLKADGLHLPSEHLPCLKFRFGARRAVAQRGVCLKLLHPFRQLVGISDLQGIRKLLFPIVHFSCLHL